MLSGHFHVPHISTGDILRAEAGRGTELGMRARAFMEKGDLVPDEVMLDLVRERLKKADCQSGFLLDGFPRSVPQASGLAEICRGIDGGIRVVSLEVPAAEVVRRLSGRRTCRACGAMYHIVFEPPSTPAVCDRCGGELYQRADDREDIVQARLEVYRNQTEPLLTFYREGGVLLEADGTGASGEVFRRVIGALEARPA